MATIEQMKEDYEYWKDAMSEAIYGEEPAEELKKAKHGLIYAIDELINFYESKEVIK